MNSDLPEWMDQDQDEKSKKKGRFRDLTGSLDSRKVRQAKTGRKVTGRQVPQTVHLNQDIADRVQTAVAQIAADWGVAKNDVWQLVILWGLEDIEAGKEPPFKTAKRRIDFGDADWF